MSGPGNEQPASDAYGYSPVALQIARKALIKCAVINDTENPSSEQMKDALDSLNSMVKEWEEDGIHVWTEEEGILFLQANQARYLIGGPKGSPDHCCDAFSFGLNVLQSNAAANATVIVVTPAPIIPNSNFQPNSITPQKGMQIGVLLDSNVAFWTTIASVAVVGGFTNITLTAPLPSSASAPNFVYFYQTNIVRPLRVPFSRRLAFVGYILTPLRMMSKQEYHDLPNPYSTGTTTQAYYNPALNQGQYFVWPVMQIANNAMRFTWYRPINSFDNPDDTADLPQEWNNCLTWNLARELGVDYSVPAQRWAIIMAEAKDRKDRAMGWDREPESVYFGVTADADVRR